MNIKNNERLRKCIWIVLMIVIFVIPLIVTLNTVSIPNSLHLLYNSQKYSELFLYGKAQILHIGTLLCVILTITYQLLTYKKEDWKKNRISLILFGLFAVSIMISFVLSENKQLAWLGMIDRFEGTFTWLCYIGLTFVVMTIVKRRKEVNGLIISFVLSVSVVSLIGVFQILGMDLFKTDLGMLMMLGSRYEELFMNVNFNFPEGRVYTTLYNPNYVGSLIALAFPLTLYIIFVMKKWWIKLIFILSIVFQLLALIGSESKGGFVAVIMTIVMLLIVVLIKKSNNKIISIGIIVAFTLAIIILVQLPVLESLKNQIKMSLDMGPENTFTTEFTSVEYNHPEIRYYLQNGEYISVSPIEGGLDVESEGEGEVIQDEKNSRLIYKITSEAYIKQVIYEYKEGLVRVNIKNLENEKSYESRFNYYYSGHFSVGTLPLNNENIHAESIEIIKNGRFMSRRGYIWNRTIPMILEKPIFGYGADTYVVNFPQGDLIYKRELSGVHTTIVDKPHNMFLNIVVNFGLLGLLLFLATALYSIVQSRFSILIIPILSYFVVGLVNDSVVFASYMMFVIFGILLVERNIEGYKGVWNNDFN
jgi:hypothetical protein